MRAASHAMTPPRRAWIAKPRMPLALKTLIYDWRRFLPAVVAVAFSGLLVLLQAAVIYVIAAIRCRAGNNQHEYY